MLTLDDILAARKRIAGGIYESPCVESSPLSQLTGAHVFCKLDYLQRTGSFKERGARNALLLLNDEQRKRGVIAASAGNHAQGIAYHGSLLGIPVTVVMPKFAALIKVTNCRHLGANVVLYGADLGEARARAEEIAREQGLTFIHPFDNANVMAGQGTMALEILEQTPDVEAIVVPVGGGGLLAGIGTVFKALRPQARVVGVEPEHAACLTAARAAGHPVPVKLSPTLADGLAVPLLGKLPFAVLERVVDQVVTVDEAHIALALAFYAWLSPSLAVGMLAVLAVMVYPLTLLGTHVLAVAGIVFVVAWIGQFVGHVIEGRKPSFFEDVKFLLVGPAWLLGFIYRRAGIRY